MTDSIIQVTNLDKDFKLPHERIGTIKGIFTNIFSFGNRKYEIQHALKNISFEVKKGEFFGIVGRNGSGKSTLLKILAGIYQPTSGTVFVNGKVIPFIELGVGFNGELTGRENVFLNGALMGFSEKEVQEKYEDIVNFAGLERFMDQKLKNYSSGMQVRLAFSVATRLAESDILLIDEVLAVGDIDFQRRCFNYFKVMKKQGKTIILVSHDMDAIREYCERAMLIERNQVLLTGPSYKVASEYNHIFVQDSKRDQYSAKDSTRWGDGKIKHLEILSSPKELKDEKNIKITVKAEAKQTVDNPVFGFVIKSASGQNILGTNTSIKRQSIKKLRKGDLITLDWLVPNVFTDGMYYIDVSAQRENGTLECDWWQDAARFKVFKEERTPYNISPDVSLHVHPIGNSG